jgi:DNA repair protein RadC
LPIFEGFGRSEFVVKLSEDSANENHRQRLREKFLRSEFSGFVDHEIVELLLTLSIPRKDVKGLAKVLLKTFGSIRGIFDADVSELMRIRGIGESTATSLKIIRVANTLYVQKSCEESQPFNSADKAVELWRSRLSNLKFEVFEVAYLDSGLRLIKDGIKRLETGTAVMAAVFPRKVAELAIRNNSTAVIVAHNHPGGPAEPSDHDERTTRTLKIALQYLDIRLLDHIIISSNGAFSFREHGLL